MQLHEGIEPVQVFAGTALQAGFVKSLLEDAGIEAFLNDEFVGTLSPWWTDAGGAGAVKVLVAGAFADQAKMVVDAYIRNINA